MKRYVVEIGYDYYEIPYHQIAHLMEIANSVVKLEYKDYQRYEYHHEQAPFVKRIELAEVTNDQDQPAIPDVEVLLERSKVAF